MGARKDWQSSEGLPVLDPPPLAEDLLWAGDSFTETPMAAPEGAPAASETIAAHG